MVLCWLWGVKSKETMGKIRTTTRVKSWKDLEDVFNRHGVNSCKLDAVSFVNDKLKSITFKCHRRKY